MRCRAASFPSNAKACRRHEKFKLFTEAQQWVMVISVVELFHLSRAKLQKNPPKRSPTVGVRARALMALDRLVDPGRRCCRLSSFAPRVSTESCHVRMNSCRGRKRKVLKVMIGLLEAVWVCNLVSFSELFVFPTECCAPLQWRKTGVERRCWQCSGQLMVAERCFHVILLLSKDYNCLTLSIFGEGLSPPNRIGECIHFQWLPGTRSLIFFLRSSWIRRMRGRIGSLLHGSTSSQQ